MRPVIIVDSREQTPLPIARLATVRAGLTTGDYSFQGGEELFAVERKSLDDLASCCAGASRERFERELHRMRGYRFARLLIIGPRWMVEGHRYRSAIRPNSILHSLAAWEVRFNVPVVWAENPAAGAALAESWAWWTARELVENANNLLRATRGNDLEAAKEG